MINRKNSPPIIDAIHFDLQLKKAEHYQLRNGVDVYAVNGGAEDVLAIEWVFFAGNWQEDKNLVAATANYLLRNGTSTKTAFQINEHFEYYGSYLNRSCYSETATITLHSLSKHIKELLPVVRELITDSIFQAEELSIYQQNMKQRLKVNLKKSDYVAGRLIDVYLFGENHPYGKYSSDDAFDALEQEELIKFYQQHYQHGKFILFVAGKLPDDLQQQLENNFGDLPNKAVDAKQVLMNPAVEQKYRIQNDKDGLQGSIRLARQFPNRHHPDFMKVQVLNTVFGGYFGSRLMNNIREDKGYTYGINSYLQNHINHSAWMIATEAGVEVCEATIAEIYKEMQKLRDEKIEDGELLLVKNYLMGGILADLDGPFQIIGRWKNIVLNNLSENYFYDSVNLIKEITPAQLQELAQQYLQPQDFYELVVV